MGIPYEYEMDYGPTHPKKMKTNLSCTIVRSRIVNADQVNIIDPTVRLSRADLTINAKQIEKGGCVVNVKLVRV